MRVKYDYFNRVDPPKFTLCNPGATYTFDGPLSGVVGVLNNTSDEEIVFNFNDVDNLNFRVSKALSVLDEQFCIEGIETPYCIIPELDPMNREQLYNSIKSRRLIYVDNVGFFVITDVTETFEDGHYYKDIKADSIEAEMRDKTVPYISDDTYPIIDTEINVGEMSLAGGENIKDGILNIVLSRLPMWSLGHVDNSVKSRWRTFEDVDVFENCLTFIRDEIQKAYECIIEFDTLNRIVNVYDRETYPEFHHTHIYLDTDGLIDTVNIRDNVEGTCTALHITGGDDLSIAAVNPLGGSIIYNFDYYMNWFTPELQTRVRQWKTAVESNQPVYSEACYQRNRYTNDAVQCRSECERLKVIIQVYQQLYDNIIASLDPHSAITPVARDMFDEVNDYIKENGDGDELDYESDVQEALDEIERIIAMHQTSYDLYEWRLNEDIHQIETYNTTITQIIDTLALDSYFDNGLYDELKHYVFEDEYNDEYITINDVMDTAEQHAQREALYEQGVIELSHRVYPKQEFDIRLNDALMMSQRESSSSVDGNFDHILEQLEIGALINVGVEAPPMSIYTGTRYSELATLGITLNYSDYSLTITVGTKYDRTNPKALFEDIFNK